jgi:hypothetical protein
MAHKTTFVVASGPDIDRSCSIYAAVAEKEA